MSVPLLMQRSIHETNTFQFVGSAKLDEDVKTHQLEAAKHDHPH
jgi:hypothetical protein